VRFTLDSEHLVWSKFHAPNSETSVQPATIFFPTARGYSIDAHENVRLAEFDGFPAVNECARGCALSKMHGDRVHLGLVRIAQRDCAHYMWHIACERGPLSIQTDKADEPTVNKNGHREKVCAGVCNLGSSTEMKGYTKSNLNVNNSSHARIFTRTLIRV
jgi:hypothetical protein